MYVYVYIKTRWKGKDGGDSFFVPTPAGGLFGAGGGGCRDLQKTLPVKG
jgi:hypothetical protein